MNMSYLPSEIINMIKDFVFSKIPKDDIRYNMLCPIYGNPYRRHFGNLISTGWTFTTYDRKIILFHTKVAVFDEVLINSEVSNRKRLKRGQILQKRDMLRMERKQSHHRNRR